MTDLINRIIDIGIWALIAYGAFSLIILGMVITTFVFVIKFFNKMFKD